MSHNINLIKKGSLATLLLLVLTTPIYAGEDFFGKVKLAETMPKNAKEIVQSVTSRSDKGKGEYQAYNTKTKYEQGITNRFQAEVVVEGQSIDTSGLIIDGYLPKDESYGLKISGLELSLKYNFLSPAKHRIGLSGYSTIERVWLDPHSGQDKNTWSIESGLISQKYLMEGRLILAGNIGYEATHAVRGGLSDLPEDFEWPTFAEMEVELKFGGGLAYRFRPNWFAAFEAVYEEEYETEVNKERYSWFVGPSIHYGTQKWWITATYLTQVAGGGETYEGQTDDLHLIEKTKNEFTVKVGYNF